MDRSTALRFLAPLLLVFGLGLSAGGQTPGILTGVVIDGVSGTPVPNATVEVDGTGLSANTDLRGSFRIDVASGTHAVTVKMKGYGTEKIAGVELLAGKVQNLGVVIMPKGGSGNATALTATADVVVTVQGPDSTEESLLVERRSASEIADNIGAREMTRGSVTNAANALQRVVGVTLVDDKSVFVRGLGERYSSTRLNGTLIPSTEPEKKVVQLDLFPSSLLEKITIAKSYTPDKPGEFAGGLVELESSDFPASPIISLSLGASYEEGTTRKAFSEYAGGTGFFGAGGQSAPDGLPAERLVRRGPFSSGGFTPEQLQTFGRSFAGTWEPEQKTAPLNNSGALTLANTFSNLGVLVSATRSAPFSYREESENRYAASAAGLVLRNSYDSRKSSEEVKQGVLANLGYKLGDAGRLKLRGFYTQNSEAESRGVDYFDDDQDTNLKDSRGRYADEQILAGQLAGEHYLQGILGSGTFVDWKAALSSGKREENVRQTLYYEDTARPGSFVFADESQSGFLLFNELEDRIGEGSLDLASTMGSSDTPLTVKYGAAYYDAHREFSSRRFRFVPQRQTLNFTQSPNELFSSQNISPTGFEISEETRSTDRYTGDQRTVAGYLMGELVSGSFRFIGGARVENAKIDVRTFDQFALDPTEVVSSLDDTDVMPALAVIYQLGGRSNVRASYSQTVNRPQFRELAPFEFTEFAEGRAVIGNPNLRRAKIRNYDLRWELFPSSREVFAVSAFYKEFTDPIERTFQATAAIRQSFGNVASARNYGAEFEARVNFATFTPVLGAFTLITNYTYVKSDVELGDAQGILTNGDRPLEGQADHVANATLELAPVGSGFSLQLFYNYTGKRISDVGTFGIPDIVEEGRSTLDLTWAQDLRFVLPGLSLKLSATNLTDAEVLYSQGGLPQRTFKEGRKYAFSLKYGLGL